MPQAVQYCRRTMLGVAANLVSCGFLRSASAASVSEIMKRLGPQFGCLRANPPSAQWATPQSNDATQVSAELRQQLTDEFGWACERFGVQGELMIGPDPAQLGPRVDIPEPGRSSFTVYIPIDTIHHVLGTTGMPGVILSYLIAHEVGHVFQWTMERPDNRQIAYPRVSGGKWIETFEPPVPEQQSGDRLPSEKSSSDPLEKPGSRVRFCELHADFLSGWCVHTKGWDSSVVGQISDYLFSNNGYDFDNQFFHGRPEHRISCFTSGLTTQSSDLNDVAESGLGTARYTLEDDVR